MDCVTLPDPDKSGLEAQSYGVGFRNGLWVRIPVEGGTFQDRMIGALVRALSVRQEEIGTMLQRAADVHLRLASAIAILGK